VIASFGDHATRDVFDGVNSKAARAVPKALWPSAKRKLDALDTAPDLATLNTPGNRLEKLKGDLAGFYSIRVNDQYRVVFRFKDGVARDVKVTDYH
jgi:proteic killer suppression protein